MTLYFTIRNGQVTNTLPLELKNDGSLWNKTIPLLDGQSEAFLADKDGITAALKAGKIDKIPTGAFAKIGLNPSGLEVISQPDYIARQKANLSAVETELAEIRRMYAKAYARREASDDNNTADYYRIKAQADRLMAELVSKYPNEANEETAKQLDTEADKLADLAKGALTYDADGWLDEEERQKRHDGLMTQSQAKRAEARSLRK